MKTFFTSDELALIVAIVGKNVNPDNYASAAAKAVIYKCQAIVNDLQKKDR